MSTKHENSREALAIAVDAIAAKIPTSDMVQFRGDYSIDVPISMDDALKIVDAYSRLVGLGSRVGLAKAWAHEHGGRELDEVIAAARHEAKVVGLRRTSRRAKA